LRKGVSFGVWYADDFVDKRPEYVGLYTQCAAYVESACEFGCGDENLFVIAAYNDLDSLADEWLSLRYPDRAEADEWSALADRGDILDAMSDYCV
jgi:hypothetical protein